MGDIRQRLVRIIGLLPWPFGVAINCLVLAFAAPRDPADGPFACDLCGHLRKALLIALGLMLIDPFGLEAATERASRDAKDRVAAAFASPSAAGSIAVVLVDDEMLAEVGGWPPPLALWQRLMERSFDSAAAAVFLDVILGTARGGDDVVASLADVIRGEGPEAHRTHAPVVLGDLGARATLRAPGPAGRSAVLPELAAAAAELAWLDWPIQADDRAYPLSLRWMPPVDATGGPQERLLPAAALARLACTHLEAPRKPAWCATAGTGWLAQQRPALIPEWALAVPPELEAALSAPDQSCELYVGGSWLASLRWTAGMIAAEGLHGLRGTLRAMAPGWVPQTWPPTVREGHEEGGPTRAGLPCPPFPIVRASTLLGGGEKALAAEDRLRGRLVLIGDASTGTPDRVVSPLHAALPGVFLHATALETLLRHGPAHPTVSEELDLGLFTLARDGAVDWALKAAFVLLAVALAFRKRHLVKEMAGHCQTLPGWAACVGLLLGRRPRGDVQDLAALETRLRRVAMAVLLVGMGGLMLLGWVVDDLVANPFLVGVIGVLVAWPVLTAEGKTEHDLVGDAAEHAAQMVKAK